MAWSELSREDRFVHFSFVISRCFAEAEEIVNETRVNDLGERLGQLLEPTVELGQMDHAAAGVVLTLAVYKLCDASQDITAHKSEYQGGFSARAYDTRVTVPFLTEKNLPRSVESHWLTQTFSFAPEFRPGLLLKTSPKRAGPLVVELVPEIQADPTGVIAKGVATAILVEKIKMRNKGEVVLTKPKDLSIEDAVRLLKSHFEKKYKKNAPRLPQIALYAAYQCIVQHVARYDECSLEPLERLKSADRKKGTVGDVVVSKSGQPFEAVEIKFDQCISFSHLSEAIDKVRALTVRRYYILSTSDICADDADAIAKRIGQFLKQNGCEIIVNGVYDSLSYYLRLLPDTTEFLFCYADLIQKDLDTDYEHRVAWNDCCQNL